MSSDDRVASGDEVVVAEAEMECGAGIDGEEPERRESAVGGEWRVDFALDFGVEHRGGIVPAGEDAQHRIFRTSGKFVPAARCVEHEPGEPER